MKITLTARELHDLVKPVLPFAGRDDMSPVLNAVLIEYRAGHLTATATDRFKAGICRRPYAPSVEFRALVGLADIKRILGLFRPKRGLDGTLTLSVEGDRIYAEAADGFGFANLRIGFALVDAEYPDIPKLFRDQLASTDEASVVGVNPDYLAAFKGVARTLRVRITDPTKPVIIHGDDHFLGLLMPRRLVGAEGKVPDAPDWSDLLQPPKKAAKKKASKPRSKKGAAA